ncbi:hypothetical protein JTE90_028095 [Oedothorax gibbosus]|uniref:CRAL-TRIO domain-containing protein n=1 Tax=Oedothorax gibbosus TaxID=931172 RepID=A0AAV6VAS6_9ARAC|nr:hypothetical protein JTE90_028095 [Oedothorax gibbosus]
MPEYPTTCDCTEVATTKFLPYDLRTVPEDIRKRAKVELFEDEETRVNSLRLLKSMLNEEKDLNWEPNDLFLMAFLRARKFDVKRAFNMMRTYYTIKATHKELYDDFNFDDVVDSLQDDVVGFLPYRDEEGCAILVLKATKWVPQENPMSTIMRNVTTGLLEAIRSNATQIAGFKVIVDVSGLTMKHLPHMSPTYLWLFAEALQNCFPARFRAVHVVNEGHLFTYVWSCLKQLLTKKLRDRFHFHGKNVTKLHKYFAPAILPAEYGGELPPYSNKDWVKKFQQSADYISNQYKYGYRSKGVKN